ncbi:MAG: archaellin/type IV pilin N-terminal domain-containing protein [Chloroflexota bacterium]|nr:archaellin/type IV pilin N-terminal domain-containing protein [Chloroflexota bacterium]
MAGQQFTGICRDERGITGLETAIILIAFIMVASVFAYVVLSAGLFSSQQAKEAIYEGLEQSESTIALKGDVLANMTAGYVDEVYLCVGTVGQGNRIDLSDTSSANNTVVISFHDQYQQIPALDWTLHKITSAGDDNMLDANELFQIVVDTSIVNESAPSEEAKLGAYHTFVLEVKPPIGAVLAIERIVPPRVTQLVNLH